MEEESKSCFHFLPLAASTSSSSSSSTTSVFFPWNQLREADGPLSEPDIRCFFFNVSFPVSPTCSHVEERPEWLQLYQPAEPSGVQDSSASFGLLHGADLAGDLHGRCQLLGGGPAAEGQSSVQLQSPRLSSNVAGELADSSSSSSSSSSSPPSPPPPLFFQALNGFVMVVTAEGYVFYTSPTIQDFLGFHQVEHHRV